MIKKEVNQNMIFPPTYDTPNIGSNRAYFCFISLLDRIQVMAKKLYMGEWWEGLRVVDKANPVNPCLIYIKSWNLLPRSKRCSSRMMSKWRLCGPWSLGSAQDAQSPQQGSGHHEDSFLFNPVVGNLYRSKGTNGSPS